MERNEVAAEVLDDVVKNDGTNGSEVDLRENESLNQTEANLHETSQLVDLGLPYSKGASDATM